MTPEDAQEPTKREGPQVLDPETEEAFEAAWEENKELMVRLSKR